MSFDRIKPEARSAGWDSASDDSQGKVVMHRLGSLAELFKALGHEGRLHILCLLARREMTVTEIETHLGQRQAAVSQQLARLRLEGLVTTRREGKAIHYALADQKAATVLALLAATGATGAA